MRPWNNAERIGMILGTIGLLILPFVLSRFFSPYHVYLMVKILIWALFAMSFNVVLGYGGMMSLGHAAFFGIGAYGYALLVVKASCPMFVALCVGPALGALAGLIIGSVCVRITGTFSFAVATLSFSQLLYVVAYKWRTLTRGDDGLQGLPVPQFLTQDQSYLGLCYFVIFVFLLCAIVLRCILGSPFGLLLRAVRGNAERCAFMGMNLWSHRLIAFVISAGFSAVAGVLYVLLETAVHPGILFWTTSSDVILMVLLGGMHQFWGPALGAGIMVLLNHFGMSYTQYWALFLGVAMIFIALSFPLGVGGLIHRHAGTWIGRRGSS
jgi:branched-chain amino acid transport system permease protein